MLKFSHKRDLSPERDLALAQVDNLYAGRAASVLEPFYAAKAEMAARRDIGLLKEAQRRGLTHAKLCEDILSNRRIQQDKVLALDEERSILKERILAATSQQEIETIELALHNVART